MAWEYKILDEPGALAGEDMNTSSEQYLIAKSSGVNNTYVKCTAKTDVPAGIIQNNPKSGEALQLRRLGISKVIAGGTLVAGDLYGPDANGKAVAKAESATGADFGDFVLGQVIEGCAVNEYATVTVGPPFTAR